MIKSLLILTVVLTALGWQGDPNHPCYRGNIDWDSLPQRYWSTRHGDQIRVLDDEIGIDFLRCGFIPYWGSVYNYADFAEVSKRWKPAEREIIVYPQPIFIDPNEPLVKAEPAEPIITFRIAATTTEGGVYHLPSCRYVTDTAKTITIEQAELYRPCRVCKPDELDSLLAEFLPKTGVP